MGGGGGGLSADDLACPICVETIEDAFATPCGHTFCFKCISTHLKNKSSCPSCGAHLVQDRVAPNFLLNKLIRSAARAQQPTSLKTALLQHVQQDLAAGSSGSGGVCLQELDAAIQLLQERRHQLASHESASKLQLLLLFLQHARSRQQGQLSELEQQLEVLEQDLRKARAAAATTAAAGEAADSADATGGRGGGNAEQQQQPPGVVVAAAAPAPAVPPAAAAAADVSGGAAGSSAGPQQRSSLPGGPGSAFKRLQPAAAPMPDQQQPQQQQQPGQLGQGFRPFGQPARQGSGGLAAAAPVQAAAGGFKPYSSKQPGAAAHAPAGAADGVQQQQQLQGGLPAAAPAAAAAAFTAPGSGDVQLPPEKRRKILDQFQELQNAYTNTRLRAPPTAAAAAAAGGVGAIVQQQQQQQDEILDQQQRQQQQRREPDGAGGEDAHEGSSRLQAAAGQGQPAAPVQQARASAAAASAAGGGARGGQLDAFSRMLYDVTHFSRLDTIACIPPPGSRSISGPGGAGSSSSSGPGGGANILSSVDFDCAGRLFAAAGVQQHVLVYDYEAALQACSSGRQQQQQQQQPAAASLAPVLDMPMRAKLSCLSFSPAVQQHVLASDYEGQAHLLDVAVGRAARRWAAHDKRIWAVNFCSLGGGATFATGSDDGTVKIWGVQEPPAPRLTLPVRANVCSCEFSPAAPHLLAAGSAGHHALLFDLRAPRGPLAVLKGHAKAVSYVRWAGADVLVTASTDATLRLWTASGGRGSSGSAPNVVSPEAAGAAANSGSDGDEGGWHCAQVFRGHANSRHFVGLATHGPFIACGSETNEVFVYHQGLGPPSMRARLQLPGPAADGDGAGRGDGGDAAAAGGGATGSSAPPAAAAPAAGGKAPFVSALTWRRDDDVLLAANSKGGVWALAMR